MKTVSRALLAAVQGDDVAAPSMVRHMTGCQSRAEARRQRHSSKGTEALPIGLEAAVGDGAAWIIVTALPWPLQELDGNSIH